jgi:hypothetical protein
MLVIGMIAFTVTGATHTNREQKQKTEFAKSISQLANNVIVLQDYQVAGIKTEATSEKEVSVKYTTNVKPISKLEAIKDVGWYRTNTYIYTRIFNYSDTLIKQNIDVGYQSSNQFFNKIVYHEKLQMNLYTKFNPLRFYRINF